MKLNLWNLAQTLIWAKGLPKLVKYVDMVFDNRTWEVVIKIRCWFETKAYVAKTFKELQDIQEKISPNIKQNYVQ